MRLGTFAHEARRFVGLVDGSGERVLDLAAVAAAAGFEVRSIASLAAMIEAGESALVAARDLVERSSFHGAGSFGRDALSIEAPLEPRRLRDVSLYPQHICHAPLGMARIKAELDGRPTGDLRPLAEPPEAFRRQPVFYFQNHLNVVGDGAVVRWPAVSRVMDFELELAIVIGRAGRDIPVGKAREHVFGYTIYNDFSARDVQALEAEAGFGPAKAKSFDGANALGPWIVTADELPDPAALAMSVAVNGEVWGKSHAGGALFSFDELIAYLSRDETLYPGEVIGCGAAGFGCGLELGRYLADGDQITLAIEGIGALANTVIRSPANRDGDAPGRGRERS